MTKEYIHDGRNRDIRILKPLKRIARLIMGKKPVIIVHSLAIKHVCNFGPIVPTISITECTKI